MKDKSNKLGKNLVFNLILFGFMGQVAWAVENNFFNTFLYNKIGGTPENIASMVAWSAGAAVLTTLIMGTLSDKVGKRKAFMTVGTILWGFTVMAFAFISRENVASLFHITDETKVRIITVDIVIFMDCLMTFMGSTSNDAAFNAWVTDVTTEKNRATTESILAIIGIAAMGGVIVAFPIVAEAFDYSVCFLAIGGLVLLAGIIGIFTIKEPGNVGGADDAYFSKLIYGFRPSVIKENKNLYLALCSAGCFAVATQVFLPYIFIYLQHYLNFSLDNLVITPTIGAVAGVAVVAVVVGVIFIGGLIDKVGKSIFVFPSAIVFVVGLAVGYFAKTLAAFAACALVIFAGYGLLMIILNAAVRDFTPDEKAGQFQGIRMIFYVFLPMVIGPRIGTWVTNMFADGTYLNEYGESVNIPVPAIYPAAACVAALIIIPLAFLFRSWRAMEKGEK